MTLKDIQSDTRNQMQKGLEALEHHLSTVRTGRANPALLKSVRVDYYGSLSPIDQLGTITAPDPRTLVVQAWDANALKAIEKAIRDSDLGLNPNNKGDSLFIVIPALTEERRRDLVKAVKSYGEDAKVAIRNARREGIDRAKKLAKDKAISEDDLKRGEAEIQKLTDEFVGKIDSLLEKKEQEVLH